MLFLEAAAYVVPETSINLVDIANDINISPAQARVYQKIYGIERIAVAEQVSVTELIKIALQGILDSQKINKKKIKFLIHTHTAQVISPWGISVIRHIQRELGLSETHVFSTSMNKCAAILSTFEMADYLLRNESDDVKALIVAGDIAFTPALRLIPNTTIAGDAAAVALVSKNGRQNKLLSVVNNTYGEYSKGVWLTAAENACFETRYLSLLTNTIQQALDKASVDLNDVALILPHNVNIPSWEKTAKQLNVSKERIYLKNIKKFSHCFSADMLINYLSACNDGLLKSGDYFLSAMVGMGATFSAAVFQH